MTSENVLSTPGGDRCVAPFDDPMSCASNGRGLLNEHINDTGLCAVYSSGLAVRAVQLAEHSLVVL